ncbi:MAG: type II secretion system F family protein [Candidatus Nanopelagicales bacterium]
MSTSPLILVMIGLCVAAVIVIIVVAFGSPKESEGRQVLMRVTQEAGRTRVIDDQSSLQQRILDPILGSLQKVGWWLTPANRLKKLEARVEAAGFPPDWDINRLVLIKVLAGLFGAALGFVTMLLLSLGFGLILMLVFTVAGFYIPDYVLDKIAEKRAAEMRRSLADTVDILNLTLEAGVGFDAALRMVAQNTNGPLAEEFGRVVQEITIGKSRAEAMYSLAERTGDEDLRRFCQTCVQAERRGTPFGEILDIQAEELRIKRQQYAEEAAQKVPVKILFPMMVFVLPVLMMVVMGPGVVMIMESGVGVMLQSGLNIPPLVTALAGGG